MNTFEMIGQVAVYSVVAVIGYVLLRFAIVYLTIAFAFIYTHAVKGKGLKDGYKDKFMWRVRIFFHFLFDFKYISGFYGSSSLSCPYFYIDFEHIFPKVSFGNSSDEE